MYLRKGKGSIALEKLGKENNMAFDDDDFKLLDSLISYQVNNLMTDAQLVQSYVFTLQISMNEYAALSIALVLRKETAERLTLTICKCTCLDCYVQSTRAENS